MPMAVAAWVGSAVFAWAGTSTVGLALAGVATSAAFYGTYAAIGYGLQQASARLGAKPEGRGFQARDIVVGAGVVPKTIVYGQAWVGGALLYMNSRHDAGTKDNFTVYRHIARTSHEVNAIVDLMFDDDIVTDASHIDWGAGHVTAGPYGLSRSGVYAVDVEKTLGIGTQTQSPLLSAAFPVDYDGSGDYITPGWSTTTIAYRYFSKTAKTAEGIFFSGPPSRELALVQGYKYYDPRADSTFPGGSGSQRLATPSTWVYGTNPALQAAHYLMTYMGVAGSRINWTWIADQADICDDLVAIPTAATEKRFTGNGVCYLGGTHADNLRALLSSMLGTLSKPSGLWRVSAAAYQTPDVSITDHDIVGDPHLKGGFGLADRYNSVTGIYINPGAFAEKVDAIPVTDAAFVARDNGRTLPTTIDLPFTNSETQAQRLAYMHLAQSDRQKVFTISVKYIGLAVTIGTRVSVTFAKFSWNTKPFRCIGWKRSETAGAAFDLTLREDDSAVWDDPPEAAYSTRDAQGVVTTGTVEIPSPTAGAANGETTVQNANFEAGDFYWTPEGTGWTVQNNSSVAHSGSRYLQYVGTDTIARYRNYINFPCRPGDRVTWGGYVQTGSGYSQSGGGAGWGIIWKDSAQADISGNESDMVTTVSAPWTAVRGYSIAPANTHFVTLTPFSSHQTSGTSYFDDGYMVVQTGAKIGEDVIDGSGNVVTDPDVLNAQQVVASGTTDIITKDSSGAWPAGNPTYARVATFTREGSTIATRTVTFSLTTATGVMTVANTSNTGETTTYAEDGDPTSGSGGIITAIVTHSGSNQVAYCTFTLNNFTPAGGGGGISK